LKKRAMGKQEHRRMNNVTQNLLYLLVFVICIATGYWLYNNFIWVNKETEVGFQGIAKTNKLLAAEFFLRKMGVPVQQVNGLIAFRNLPSAKHTLLIATQRETLNKDLSQALLNWVHSGGHLIVEARYFSDNTESETKTPIDECSRSVDDPLLDKLSLFSVETDAGDENQDIPVTLNIEDGNIQVNFPYQRILSNSCLAVQPQWIVKDELGLYVMQFTQGQGLLTILASTSIFGNDKINEFDHARFLHYLVQQPAHDAGVWLVRVDDMPALWKWLWQNAWHVLFSISILFMLWLWRAPLRFGPQLEDRQPERRSLLEHIQASGYYRWHKHQSAFLLTKVQEALWDKIHTSHPIVRRENLLQAYTMLEEITGIKKALIQQALTKKTTTKKDSISEHEFTQLIQLLELIRKHL
jgi:hypothetical protein